MFIEDDDLAVEEVASAIQTRCLGRKQSTACWLPELRPDVAADAGVVCAGTWDEAENELEKIDLKLQGINQMRSPTALSVEGQVQRLINEATDITNLSQMYIWWMPWC